MAHARTFLSLFFCILSGNVWAQQQDVVKLRSSLSIQNNDNFFSAPASTAVSERITSQTVGINVAVPYSLQRFELDASLTATQHQTYTNFDFIARNYRAAWLWSFTPHLHGSLNTTRAEGLNAAIDSLDPKLRNKSTTTSTGLSAVYEKGGPWQLLAGLTNNNVVNERAVIGQPDGRSLTNNNVVNEQAVIGQPDGRSTSVNGGLRYVRASGNSLGYLLQVGNGNSSMLQVGNGNSSNDYTTRVHDVNGVWLLTGKTSLTGHLAYSTQDFGAAPQYSFSGFSGGANLTWRITGKTSLQADWQRDLASYRTATASYLQTDAFTVAPVWQVTPKTSLSVQFRSADLRELGSPFGALSHRQDTLRDTSLSVTWQPRRLVNLTASVSNSSRKSSAPGFDFTGHQVSVSAQFVL
jgi:exopolysaccharide biosynthesis operon protein EpsL